MTDPKRWLDDADAPSEVRDVLRGAMRARPLEAEARRRVGSRVARVAALPISLGTLLSVKSAAALGVGVGLVTASVSVAVFELTSEKDAEPAPSALVQVSSEPRRAPGPGIDTPPSPAPEAPAAADSAAPPSPPSAPPKASSGSLAEESQLLERARQALDSSPAETLARVREYGSRFPHGKLVSERNLLELDALYRLGRRAEAHALAERLLSQGGDDLYTARIRRLSSKIDQGR